jgi:NAD(P)-dependent dehydrogenase (short-subunit alcohol dehydrogenase family)
LSHLLREKVAVVTGGGSGIGRATALEFSKEGAKVVIADINEADGTKTIQQIRRNGGIASFVKTDISDASQVESLVSQVVDQFGGLDIALNNAGIEGKIAPIEILKESDWEKIMSVNLKGVWLCMKSEISRMKSRKGGTIVNVASLAGTLGIAGQAAYCASKAGVIQLTRVAALECAKYGIRVNSISPGQIDTPMSNRLPLEMRKKFLSKIPLKRSGTPEEVAVSATWLASDLSSYVTGQSLIIDGGLSVG